MSKIYNNQIKSAIEKIVAFYFVSILNFCFLIAPCKAYYPFPEGRQPLEAAKVAKFLSEAGFPSHSISKMVCAAKYESQFFADARNHNRNGTVDSGLFQINDLWLDVCKVTKLQLLNPRVNIYCALVIYNERGMNAWIAYKKMKKVCDSFRSS